MKFILPLLLGCSCSILSAQSPHPQSALKGEAYITTMKQRLTINQRDRDPFGLHQDLTVRRHKEPKQSETRTSLAEATAALKITAVNGSLSFIHGPREFRLGETFILKSKKQTYRVRVQSIAASAITLLEISSGERAVIDPKLTNDLQFDPDDVLFDGIQLESPDGPPVFVE